MVRRSDNQLVQLPPLLYLVAQHLDGHRDVDEVGAEVTAEVGRELAGEDVAYLIDEKLAPLGVAVASDGREPDVEKADQLLALRLRTRVIPEGVVTALARVFQVLFWPPIVIAAVACFLAFDVWFFFVHGVSGGAHEAIYRPALLLLTLGLVIVAAVFHEIGHAAGCRYGGAQPGVMGVGLYIVWPAFYTDVTDAYRLGRGGRLRTDLGGVYFNALFVLLLGGLYALTGLESLLLGALLVHFEMAHQMLPFLRLDGYYVVADLVGVPDLFQRIRPILLSFLPGRPVDPRVEQLKPWVRFAVTGWVMVVVPIIAFQIITVAVVAPRIFGTALDSLSSIWRPTAAAFGSGRWLAGSAGIVQLLVLILPLAGIAYMFWMLGVRFVRGWRDTKGRPVARSMLSATGIAALVLLALAWWPDPRRYEPIRSDEQWIVPVLDDVYGGPDPNAAYPEARTPAGDPSPVPTPAPSSTTTPTPGTSPSPSPSPSPSLSPSPSPSATPTASASPTSSPSRTTSVSPSSTTSVTPSPAASSTASSPTSPPAP
jgi:putative peptide zinc metalloprotease protein